MDSLRAVALTELQRRTMTLVCTLPDLPQSILTGHVPGFVLEPTLHVQVIFVPRFAPNPAAREAVVAW